MHHIMTFQSTIDHRNDSGSMGLHGAKNSLSSGKVTLIKRSQCNGTLACSRWCQCKQICAAKHVEVWCVLYNYVTGLCIYCTP